LHVTLSATISLARPVLASPPGPINTALTLTLADPGLTVADAPGEPRGPAVLRTHDPPSAPRAPPTH
jgi:hypothetical protein